MRRREFMKLAAGAAASGAFGSGNFAFAKDDQSPASVQISPEKLMGLFESDNPKVLKLTEKIFRDCILNKVYPPKKPLLKHRWVAPGGGFYGLWIWDTMFVVDLLSTIPGQEKLIREIFQNYWDFQQAWNVKMPKERHDMIPCMIIPDNTNWKDFPAYSQIPILGWGLERVYKRNKDKKLIKMALGNLERFHEWYWRERDVTDIGLIGVGAYSSDVQHGRYETFDFDRSLDDLKLTPHPGRKADPVKNGNWYGNVLVTGNTSYLLLAEKSLARLAVEMGDKKMAARRKVRIKKCAKAIQKYMWDEDREIFSALDRDSLKKYEGLSIGSLLPLYAGAASKRMAKKLADTLDGDAWMTPLLVPTMPKDDPKFQSSGYWRGDVWPPSSYQVARGLYDYGYKDQAAEICDRMVANAIKNGVNEHYDSITGKPIGVEGLGMSCTILTMMFDGMTKKYKLKVKT
ncbi:MAG: hypothetical protein J7M40_04915 [Planctomycetes bacterium]|nr:hypothetical protein [Planctomycetota bacterium]